MMNTNLIRVKRRAPITAEERQGIARAYRGGKTFEEIQTMFSVSETSVKRILDENKIPSTIAKYGNTSSVSVPLTIVSELQNQLVGKKTLLLSAFGVGMSWATAIVPFDNCKISDIVEI